MDRSATMTISAGSIADSTHIEAVADNASIEESRSIAALVPDEVANQLTHGIGFLLSLVGAVIITRTSAGTGDTWRIVGCHIYAYSLVSLYLASTLSHSFQQPRLRSFFRTLDQVCIFLLMAGGFTPFALAHLRDGAWWMVLAGMWLFALVGIGVRVYHSQKTIPTGYFVLLGLIPMVTLGRMVEVSQLSGLMLFLAGAVSYAIGTVFLFTDDKVRYFHAAWHVCVIWGSICHFMFLFLYVAH